MHGGDDVLEFVAELDGEVVGAMWARLVPPLDEARFQITPARREKGVHVDFLVTGEPHRRAAVATTLAAAAEAWGEECGATLASCDTYAASPVPVPFWHEWMGSRTCSLRLSKWLA